MTAQLKPAVKLDSDQQFLSDVLSGLSADKKSLPCKYFYDQKGSQIYEQICLAPEYYPTRTESTILADHASDMAHELGKSAMLVEYGSGASTKTRQLLDHMIKPAGYVPIDISGEYLEVIASNLSADYTKLPIEPVAADFTKPFQLPDSVMMSDNRVIYYPGSSIGNFERDQAEQLLCQMRSQGNKLLIGYDLLKCATVLEAAYNDSQQVTAAFNLNLLARINRELDANFDLDKFFHKAVFNRARGRIEMHLVSLANQNVSVAGHDFHFNIAETIHTENSHKYSLPQFEGMAELAGWNLQRTWMDDKRWFAVQLYV